LVADDRIVEPRFERIATHGLEHPTGNEHDVNSGRVRRGDRSTRPRSQQRVFADQRPVEVARDGLNLVREVGGESQPCGLVRKSTRSLSCWSDSFFP
jgi:hypothetical protein